MEAKGELIKQSTQSHMQYCGSSMKHGKGQMLRSGSVIGKLVEPFRVHAYMNSASILTYMYTRDVTYMYTRDVTYMYTHDRTAQPA